MLKIKLVRFGKRNQPHYRIVVQEARTKSNGKYTAKIGHYAPTQDPKTLEINMEEYKKWLVKGAQPTPTVAGLAKRFESGNPFPPKKATPSKKQLAKNKAAQEKPAEEEVVEKVEAVEEKPAEEEVVEKVEAVEEKPAEEEVKTEETN